MPNDSTPKQRQLRSGSGASSITLSDIKTLIEDVRTDIVKTFTNQFDDLKSAISSLQLTIKDLENNYSELITKYINLETELNILKDKKPDELSSISSEVEDRMSRSCNFIVSGVAESSSVFHNQDDKSACTKILDTIGLNADDIDEVFRLGKIKDDSNAPRLLKVKCKSAKFRNSVLRKAKDLRRSSDFKRVYINPDLTPLQQTIRKRLLEEYRQRTMNGENVVIFRDRIVHRTDRKNFDFVF